MPDTLELPDPVDINDFLDEPEPEYNWLIPGLLERGDRLILTGNEGKGKSTLMRQMAVQAALGLVPFSLHPMPALKVLFLDLENGRSHIRREFTKITAGRVPVRGQLTIECLPQGLDLSARSDREAFISLLRDTHPDLLITGPMYKLAPKLEREDESAHLAHVLDTVRTAFDLTLILESHQPHAVFLDKERIRPERPFGSSLWMRWPEFGFCLEDAGTLRAWRGARDGSRTWPEKLRRGDEWVWELDDRLCEVCDSPLKGKQERYCSEECGAVARKRAQRARARG